VLLIASPERSSLRLEIVPPPGLRVASSPPAQLATSYGTFVRTDAPAAKGGGLTRDESLELFRGRIPPDQYLDFAAFAASVDNLEEQPIRLTP
jgi:cellulose synthase operon protein C